jgi:hypothetical protein
LRWPARVDLIETSGILAVPLLVFASLLLQVLCAAHAIRTGRPYYWIFIIMFTPPIGMAVYFFLEILPDLRQDPRSRKAARQMLHTFDPERQRRHIKQRLEMADTVDNRRALAEECVRLGDYANAVELYRSMLKGVFATDAGFLLGLAQAQANCQDFTGARSTLDTLFAAHPQFRSSDADLLRARVLEQQGEHTDALAHYEILARSYPGEEARYRYGALLKQNGRFSDARTVFAEMLARAKHAPRYYRKKEKGWLESAQKELARLGPG